MQQAVPLHLSRPGCLRDLISCRRRVAVFHSSDNTRNVCTCANTLTQSPTVVLERKSGRQDRTSWVLTTRGDPLWDRTILNKLTSCDRTHNAN